MTELKNLYLVNFRNFSDFKIDFSRLNVIYGPNGIGKSNLIEAIYLLSTSISPRTNQNNKLIYFGADFSRLMANFSDNLSIEFTMQIKLKKILKKIKINQVETKLREAIGKFKVVLFSPESIKIILGPPNERRRYVNLILSQIDKKYLKYLFDLRKILKQRNKLLSLIKSNMAKEPELAFWDSELIKINDYIVKKRIDFLDLINEKLSSYYCKISNAKEKISLKYLISLPPQLAKEQLAKNRLHEINMLQSLYGPHRDEILFNLEGHSAFYFSSQGEARTLVLALKLMEIDFYKTKTGQNPILLLDDVFSELDKDRVKHLLKVIKNQQTIITTTNLDNINKYEIKDYQVINLATTQNRTL